MRDCVAGPASPQKATTGIPRQKIKPSGAIPYTTKPTAPQSNPINTVLRSPNRAVIGRISPSYTIVVATPAEPLGQRAMNRRTEELHERPDRPHQPVEQGRLRRIVKGKFLDEFRQHRNNDPERQHVE